MDTNNLFVLLSGGASRRMGQNKAELTLDGKAISERIIEDAQTVFKHCLIADNQQLPDYCDQDFQGPLSGLAAGLSQAKQLNLSGIVCFPCDTLILPSQLFPLMPSDTCNLCFSSNNKTLPLLGRYSVDILTDLQHYLDSGERRVMRFIDAINPIIIELPRPLTALATYNTLKEFEHSKDAYYSLKADNAL